MVRAVRACPTRPSAPRRRLEVLGVPGDVPALTNRAAKQRAAGIRTRLRSAPTHWVMPQTHIRPKSSEVFLRPPTNSKGPAMPRHENTPLYADKRLNRRHPDLLPTHRQCPDCLKVLALNGEQFYETPSRYPWNLSRYGTKCKPCTRTNSLDRAAARRPLRNAKDRQRRAQARAGLQALSARPMREGADAIAKRFRVALLKRSIRRVRGPYSIATDPIKMLIRQRQKHAHQVARMREASVSVDPPLSQLKMGNEQREYLERLQVFRDDPERSHIQEAKQHAGAASAKPPGWLPFGIHRTN
jgi:hypothetical protein